LTTPVIIDAIALAVLAGFAVWGACRGLLRTRAGLLVLALSLTGAGFIASALSGPAAKLAAPAIEKRLESRLDASFQERFPDEAEPPPLGELLELLGIDEVCWDAFADQVEKTVRDTGASLAAAVIENAAGSMLYGALYVVSFVLLSAALHLLVRMLDAVLRLPGLHGLNAVGGGVAGILEGALLLFLAVWVLRLLGVSFDGESGTKFFKFFTEHTPLDALAFLGA